MTKFSHSQQSHWSVHVTCPTKLQEQQEKESGKAVPDTRTRFQWCSKRAFWMVPSRACSEPNSWWDQPYALPRLSIQRLTINVHRLQVFPSDYIRFVYGVSHRFLLLSLLLLVFTFGIVCMLLSFASSFHQCIAPSRHADQSCIMWPVEKEQECEEKVDVLWRVSQTNRTNSPSAPPPCHVPKATANDTALKNNNDSPCAVESCQLWDLDFTW